jgi:hypothetical protein
MRFSASLFVPMCLGVVLVACSSGDAVGGLCAKSKDCVKQTNPSATFDDMACRNELKGYRDNAMTQSCAGQFDDLINCISAQSCTATEAQLQSACAMKISALQSACKAPGDGGGGGEAGPVVPPGGTNMDRCTATSKCPNDPKLTQAQIDMCKSNTGTEMTKCPNESKAFALCFYNNWTCTSEGTTDPLATISKCQAESDALQKCVG